MRRPNVEIKDFSQFSSMKGVSDVKARPSYWSYTMVNENGSQDELLALFRVLRLTSISVNMTRFENEFKRVAQKHANATPMGKTHSGVQVPVHVFSNLVIRIALI